MVLSEREMIVDAEAWLRNNEVANGQISARRLRSCLKIPALAAEEDLAAECRALADEIEAVSVRANEVASRLDAFERKWGRPE